MRNARIMIATVMSSIMMSSVSPRCLANDQQSVEELRNTVINLLQALVDQGVISKDKAAQMVKAAQEKAAADAAAVAKTDEGAVRVPYVPQIVKDEISKQVAEAVKPEVVADVVQQAKTDKWGVPGALPDWLSTTQIFGSVLLREEAVLYGSGNTPNYYYNYNTVNSAGGIVPAGANAFIDTNVDRIRFRGAARLGIESDLTDSIKTVIRLSTGNTSDLVSPTQTLDGTAPYSFGVDNLYMRLDERNAQKFPWLTVIGGRFPDPWFAPTDLIFNKQLNFNGLAITGRLGLGDHSAEQSHLFLTAGAMPVQEVALSTTDKWLCAGQFGANLRFAGEQRLKLGAALYDYLKYEGRENSPNSTLLDYTAPTFFRTGNTVFNILNNGNPDSDLFALASKFRLVSISAQYSLPLGARYVLGINADAVKNVGFKEAEIYARTGQLVVPRTKGYQAEMTFGYPSVIQPGAWRVVFGYRYLQRDAVIDAFTDSDFHAGGTDAEGYYVTADLGLVHRLWLRLKYMSANQIDLAPYAVDTLQVDLNTQF
jgi:hypothetical protein